MTPAPHTRVLGLLILVGLPGVAALHAQAPAPARAAPVLDYAVYRAVVMYLTPESRSRAILIVDSVRPDSATDPDADWWRRFHRHERNLDLWPYANLAYRDSALLAPFITANRTGLRLSRDSLRGKEPVVLVPSDNLSDSAWMSLRRTYPEASSIIRFSRVGFSPDGEQAVVDVATTCGPALCAARGYYFLKRMPTGTWRVVHYLEFFAS